MATTAQKNVSVEESRFHVGSYIDCSTRQPAHAPAVQRCYLLEQRLAASGCSQSISRCLNLGVCVDPAIAQKWPMRAVFIHALPFDFCDNDFFSIDRLWR